MKLTAAISKLGQNIHDKTHACMNAYFTAPVVPIRLQTVGCLCTHIARTRPQLAHALNNNNLCFAVYSVSIHMFNFLI